MTNEQRAFEQDLKNKLAQVFDIPMWLVESNPIMNDFLDYHIVLLPQQAESLHMSMSIQRYRWPEWEWKAIEKAEGK